VKFNLPAGVKTIVIQAPNGYVIDSFCAKGGQQTDKVTADQDGVTLILTMSNAKDISHFAVRFRKQDVPDGGAWCSPGFWRNNYDKHGASAWPQPAVDYANTLYSAIPSPVAGFGKPALKNGAPANATALQVLESPQTYGGPAFNYVGTWLSDLVGLNVQPDPLDPTKPFHNCTLAQQGGETGEN
jgi:hypothetical protein